MTMATRHLEHEDLPEWFKLTIDQGTGFPCFKIRTCVLERLKPSIPDPQTMERIRTKLHLKESVFPFHPTFGDRFGFGDSLPRIAQDKNYTTYRCELPIILDVHGRLNTLNTGPTSLSIQILSTILAEYQPRHSLRDGMQRQLLTVCTGSGYGQNGNELNGVFSPHFVNHLRQYEVGHYFPQAEQAMVRVHEHMWRNRELAEHRMLGFTVRQYSSPGNLHMSLPGHSSTSIGTYPSPRQIPSGRGVSWFGHNVDSGLQQLTILTGLAAMCDIVE
jgi:hypothetical protein